MIVQTPQRPNLFNRLLNLLMLSIFAVAIVAFVLAPLFALSWRHQPFAGFLVDPTLVANGASAPEWSGANAGITFPQKVQRVAGVPVANTTEFNRALAARQVGDQISIFTITPGGVERLYPNIGLMTFSARDMARLFWLPYLIGAAYLVIGIWIYRLRGHSRPGRALAFFCVITAGVCGLLFDLSSTHQTIVLWVLAVANIGGSLISLALRFPEEWLPERRYSWLLAVPYLISMALAVRGIISILDPSRPWAYAEALGASYRYAGIGILFFFAVMLYQARAGRTMLIRQQARLVLTGSIVAFTPVSVWLLAPLFGYSIKFNPEHYLPPLLLFPLSISVAILRFRLWDIDSFVSRAFVYATVTAILAGVFAALISMTQKTFVLVTGEKSDAAVVLSTLIIAAVFTPLRSQVQGFVDRQLREEHSDGHELRSFGADVRAYVQMCDINQLTRRLLDEAVLSLEAESGALSLAKNGHLEVVHTWGAWKNDARVSVALHHDGHQYGLLQLGPPRTDRLYSERDGQLVQQAADQVAVVIHLAQPHMDPIRANGASHSASIGQSRGNGIPLSV